MSTSQCFRAAILTVLPSAQLPDHIEPGKRQRYSTNGKRTDTSGWLLLFTDMRGGIFGCWRAGLTQTWSAQNDRPMTAGERLARAAQIEAAKRIHATEQRQQWATNAKRLAALWQGARTVVMNDPVARYLCHRLRLGWHQIAPLIGAKSIRCHRGLNYRHEDGRVTRHPGMVAALQAPDGALLTVHRTYLTDGGEKADLPQVKKLMPAAGLLNGGCIRLGEPNPAGRIGVAEGIETALAFSLASHGLPMVAAYSAAGLASWQWPTDATHIVIAADNDDAGERAASELRQRVIRGGLQVSVLKPSEKQTDWCDVWAKRTALEAHQ